MILKVISNSTRKVIAQHVCLGWKAVEHYMEEYDGKHKFYVHVKCKLTPPIGGRREGSGRKKILITN